MEVFIQITGTLLVLASLSYAKLIFTFTTGWFRLRRKGDPGRSMETTSVSVVVAARNEAGHVGQLLHDLYGQDYSPASMEIILIDDRSTDATAELAMGLMSANNEVKSRLISMPGNENQGSKKAAMEEAINMASGEIILTTDADCRIPKQWVSTMTGYFTDPRVNMVAGPVSYYGVKSVGDRFQALEFLGLVASGAGAAGAGQPFLCNGANLAFRKEAFQWVDGYEGNRQYQSGDDVFLLHKMKRAFGSSTVTFALDRRALVRTRPAPGLGPFLAQRARWASKSPGYKDPNAMVTALTVFILSLIMAAIFLAGFFYPAAFLVYAGLVLAKSLADLPLLRQVTGFTGDRKLMKWLVPFQFVYPFYVIVAGILGMFRKRKW